MMMKTFKPFIFISIISVFVFLFSSLSFFGLSASAQERTQEQIMKEYIAKKRKKNPNAYRASSASGDMIYDKDGLPKQPGKDFQEQLARYGYSARTSEYREKDCVEAKKRNDGFGDIAAIARKVHIYENTSKPFVPRTNEEWYAGLSAVGWVECDGYWMGTASVMETEGPHDVIAWSAHQVGDNCNFRFRNAYGEKTIPIAYTEVGNKNLLPSNNPNELSGTEDWAVSVLSSKVREQTGSLSFIPIRDLKLSENINNTLQISSIITSKNINGEIIKQIEIKKGNNLRCSVRKPSNNFKEYLDFFDISGVLAHDCNTKKQTSGGPVVKCSNKKCFAVCVHSGQSEGRRYSSHDNFCKPFNQSFENAIHRLSRNGAPSNKIRIAEAKGSNDES